MHSLSKSNLLVNTLVAVAASTFLNLSVNAAVISAFADNFEGDLSQWTGKASGPHNGIIVPDPLNASNHVLTFTAQNSAGDIFTIDTLTTTTTFTVSFDYLGTPALGGNGNGGFFGISTGFPDSHYWVAGTGGYPAPIALVDDGTWHTYSLTFSSPVGVPVHLMLEDFLASDTIAGNAFFDNFNYHDSAVPPVDPPRGVPDSGTTLTMLGMALSGMAMLRRKFRN